MVLDVGTWEQIFQELIQEVKPRTKWTLRLEENLQPDRVAQGWKQYQQRAFGRWVRVCSLVVLPGKEAQHSTARVL